MYRCLHVYLREKVFVTLPPAQPGAKGDFQGKWMLRVSKQWTTRFTSQSPTGGCLSGKINAWRQQGTFPHYPRSLEPRLPPHSCHHRRFHDQPTLFWCDFSFFFVSRIFFIFYFYLFFFVSNHVKYYDPMNNGRLRVIPHPWGLISCIIFIRDKRG